MNSNNSKYIFLIVFGLYIVLKGMNNFHFLPIQNNLYSPSYTLGKNTGLFFRVFLGLALVTKGILFFKANKIK